jgi:acetyltransferase
MVNNLRGSQILNGARGLRPLDVDALVESLLRMSQLLTDHPEITELDINPLRVLPDGEGCLALDARIILG